jgi:hypothetical protein
VTVPKTVEILGNPKNDFPLFWEIVHFFWEIAHFQKEIAQIFWEISEKSGKSSTFLGQFLGDYSTSELIVIGGPKSAHMRRTDVTDGTLGRAFTALVYNGVSNGLWHTILLNLKNHIKTGGVAGRVRAARSDKKIETIETRVVLIWNMQHSQDNGSDTSVGFEVSKATVIKINASKFKVVAVNSNWRSGGVNVERFESQR